MSQSSQPNVDGKPRTVRRTAEHVAADLTLYAALTGGLPEIDPALADPLVAATRARQAHPWSPGVLSVYLREVVRAKGPQLNRPAVAAWVRRQSAIARRRLSETHARVTAAAFTVGPREAVEDEE